MDNHTFTVTHKSSMSAARTGELRLPHGTVQTPAFMPDATLGFIKSLPYFLADSKQTEDKNSLQMFVTNTLHTFLNIDRPILEETKGIHKFINWEKPILSDSGGFQVFSMGTRQNAPITEKGITFKNPINGDKHLFTPEKSMAIQRWLGTDIRVVLDYFTDPKLSKEEKVRSVEITTRWANRAKEEWQKDPKSMIVAVVQGDTNLGLREKSLTGLKNIGFHGYGFGGWPIVNKKLDTKTLKHFCEITSTEHFTGSEVKYKSPFRYAMGIGTPDDIKRCVKMGFDLFDTVLPTRNARHGYLYSSKGTVRIKNAQYKNDFTAVDPNCECITCKFHTRAYLRYLFKKKSHLGYMFASLHNLHFYLQLMRDLREEIKRDTL